MAFFDNIRFPFFTMQELNLDWILNELKRIAGFMPQDGNPGDVLTRKSSGAAWETPSAVQVNIDGLPEDTQIMDNDQLIFYDISAQANRKIKPPNMLDSMCSNAFPMMDGTAAAGTSKKPARYDHVHPTDTSRAPATYFQNGCLKVVNGGTGADNAADARDNLGLGDVSTEDVVPVSKGGTGADNATDARTNLGLVPQDLSITLDTTWTDNSTWAEQIGNLVIVHVYVNGTPTNGKLIASGLPVPAHRIRITDITGCGIAELSTAGVLSISSASTGSWLGATIAYGV